MANLLMLCLSMWCLTRPAEVHDFHVSKCLIEYNPQVRRLQISMHLFLDDLELALQQKGWTDLRLCQADEAAEAENYLKTYILENFRLSVSDSELTYEYLGKEVSDDLQGVWIYLESPPLPALPNLTVTQAVLLEVYDDQKNIVSIFGPGDTHGVLLFEPGKTTDTAYF